jgi:hypothetical protein
MVEHRNYTWTQLSTPLDLRLAIGVLAVVAIVAALGGYLVGTNRSGVSIHTGKAHSVQAQISVTGEDGWVYSVPLDVNWTDASGVWHEGDRPVCLPPVGDVPAPLKFAATQVTVNGMTWRPVVWVSCRN